MLGELRQEEVLSILKFTAPSISLIPISNQIEPCIISGVFLQKLETYAPCHNISGLVFQPANGRRRTPKTRSVPTDTSRAGSYEKNRVDESVTEEDRATVEEGKADPWDLRLQTLFVWVYGWQDKAVEQLDALCRSLARVPDTEEALQNWYSDRGFLARISPLCLCTNNIRLVVFSLLDQLELFLILLISLMNFYALGLLAWKVFNRRLPGGPCA